jgi:DNA-binding beta-propeller fold protein YncE
MSTTVAALFLLAAPASAAELELAFVRDFGKRIDNGEGHTNYPSNIAVDHVSGDVFVMDLYFNRIQRFTAAGEFQNLWACSKSLGLAFDPHAEGGALWVAAWNADTVRKYDLEGNLLLEFGSTGSGPGQFEFPHDVAVHPLEEQLFVLDDDNGRVQVFELDGTFLREWPLSNPQQPFGIEIEPGGQWLVVSNTANRELQKYSVDGELLASWARAGSDPGQFRWPRDIAVGADGSIYVADTDNERGQKLDQDGNFVAWINGPNDREHGEFHPRGIEVNRTTGEVYATAAYAHRIDHFDSSGAYADSFGTRTREGPVFNQLKGIAIDPASGEVFVSDWLDHRIKRFDRAGRYLTQFDAWIEDQTPTDGHSAADLDPDDPTTRMWTVKEDQAFPAGMAVDGQGNLWMIRGSMHYDDDPRVQADWLIRRFDKNGRFLSGFGHPDFPRDAKMRDLAVDPVNNHLYVANSGNHKLMKFDFAGNLLWAAGGFGSDLGQLNYPTGVALDLDRGEVYVTEAGNDRVQVFDLAGSPLRQFGSLGSAPGELKISDFSHVALDAQGYVYVADTGNNRVSVFARDGRFVTSMGEFGYGLYGKYAGVTAVAVHEGHLYVGDNAGYEVEVFEIRYGAE